MGHNASSLNIKSTTWVTWYEYIAFTGSVSAAECEAKVTTGDINTVQDSCGEEPVLGHRVMCELEPVVTLKLTCCNVFVTIRLRVARSQDITQL